MKRTTLAVALATGVLAVPAVALAAGGDGSSPAQSPSATPTQSATPTPRGHDCPNHDGSGGSSGSGGETSL